MPQGLIPEELSFAFLKTLSIASNVPRFAAARARHEEGRKRGEKRTKFYLVN
jgi:hypothetical protein